VEEAGHLAARQALDHQLQQRVVGVGGDGVGPLRCVAVGSAQAYDVVLARQVVDALVDVEAHLHQLVGRVRELDDPAGRPAAGRRVRHGSPW
jgi:hypothetical protein